MFRKDMSREVVGIEFLTDKGLVTITKDDIKDMRVEVKGRVIGKGITQEYCSYFIKVSKFWADSYRDIDKDKTKNIDYLEEGINWLRVVYECTCGHGCELRCTNQREGEGVDEFIIDVSKEQTINRKDGVYLIGG